MGKWSIDHYHAVMGNYIIPITYIIMLNLYSGGTLNTMLYIVLLLYIYIVIIIIVNNLIHSTS